MEHRSTSDLLRDLQAISSELARRHAAEQQDGGGQSAGSAAQLCQGGIQILETPPLADTDAGVEKNAIEASQDIPTIGAILTSTPEW